MKTPGTCRDVLTAQGECVEREINISGCFLAAFTGIYNVTSRGMHGDTIH